MNLAEHTHTQAHREQPRVLSLATTVPARPGDGTPEFVLNLVRALAKDYRIILLAPRVKGSQQLQEEGLEVRRFPYFLRPWEGIADGAILPNLKKDRWRIIEVPFLIIGFLVAAARIARRWRPCIVHANWILPGGLIALLIRSFYGIPYVVTVLGDDAHRLQTWPLPALKRLIMRRATAVLPLSREMGLVLGFTETDADRYTIPLGVDVAAIEQDVGERSPEPDRLLFVGRLVEKKGLDVLLHALSRLVHGRLYVVGDGPERPALEGLVDTLQLHDRVTFLGQGSAAEVRTQFRSARAVVIPSRTARSGDKDGTPLVMCEAMAAGVPIVASRLGGLAEHIIDEENGLLVEPASVDELAEALRRILSMDDTDLVTWAKRARESMIGKLDISTTRVRYNAFFQEALQDAPKGCADPPTL